MTVGFESLVRKLKQAGAIASVAGLAVLSSVPSHAAGKTFRFAFQGELKAVDIHALNESFSLGVLSNVYEGLVRRNAEMKLEPALAESWETPEPTRWRFHLRKGVKFHNGEDFTADDVVFSADRVRSPGSDLKGRLAPDITVKKVDDFTVDFVLKTPNPILANEWETFGIFSKKWAEVNGATEATSASSTTPPYAALHANGTGPFIIVSHEPGVKTVFKANPNWWDKPKHNLDEVVFTPITSSATRVAALLSGEVDWIDPVPVADIPRVESNPGTVVAAGPELRTIYLSFDQMRPELTASNIKGKNPFKDVRVRKAFYQAIDIETIKTKVMRNLATPSPVMIAPALFSKYNDFKRFPYDPEASKKLLAEAGYPQGFEVTLDCPNDRYVNDEAICQAVVGMLARVGVKINLLAQTKSKYFGKILQSGGYDTSFYLLGWTPATLESYNVFYNLMMCRDEKGKGSPTNLGGYCNPKMDDLVNKALNEPDPKKQEEMYAEAYKIALLDDVGYIPLHQQALAWGMSKKIKVPQRPDNYFIFAWVNKE